MTRHPPKKNRQIPRGPEPLQWYLPPGRCNHQDHRNSHQDHWWVQDTPAGDFPKKLSSFFTFSTSIVPRKIMQQKTRSKSQLIKSSNNDLTFVVCLLETRKCVQHWALTLSPEKQREHWRLRSRHCHKHNRLVLHPNHLLHSPGEFSPSQWCSLWFLWFCDIMNCAFFTKLATKTDPWSSSPQNKSDKGAVLATFKHNKDQQHRSLTNPTWPNTQSARSAKLPQSLFQPLA